MSMMRFIMVDFISLLFAGGQLQEIVSIYHLLHPPKDLTPIASNRVCNALALLQCVASHNETRELFLGGE